MLNKTVNTTCAYCGVGCGIQAEIVDVKARKVNISGQWDHPANFGRLCSKGISLADTLGLEGRLLHPEINGRMVSWEKAVDTVADRLQQSINRYGPGSVAMYLSGQLLTEDYYIANKLMKGFIGSANVDTNSRLCMASSVAGHKRAFGSDTVPGCYEDLELAELIVLTGSNTAWCHPIIFQRIKAAKLSRPGMKIVVIDPRRTATCEIADLHLGLKSGTDSWLFNGLLTFLATSGSIDRKYIAESTVGFEDAVAVARQTAPDIETVASECGLAPTDLATFYNLFQKTSKTVTVYSQGINQSGSGTDKVNAIINCHLATGRIGKPGMGPFSLTGQPNAMGGREVGGLANQLAAHMDFSESDIQRVSRFWSAPAIARNPGLKAVDLFEAVGRGEIKVVWIMGTNPAVSMPNASAVERALSACETVIVSDCIRQTDTAAYADILLPATGWGEKDGTVTNSERCISRQRALLPAPGEARHDWQIIRDVAVKMGFADAFDYQQSWQIFEEHAMLSGFENNSEGNIRDFDISGLIPMTAETYDTFEARTWPITGKTANDSKRLFTDGHFFNTFGKARLIPIEPASLDAKTTDAFPLVLNTGRIRDQWHTMTRTGLAPQLNQHITEPYCEIHPSDAENYGIKDHDLIVVKSPFGSMVVRAQISADQLAGNLFVPMHWTDQLSGKGRVAPLVNPVTDPVSGQPESKHTAVRVESYKARWHGFAFSRVPLQVKDFDYWVKIKGQQFYRYEFAGLTAIESHEQWSRQLLRRDTKARQNSSVQWLEYHDQAAGKYRTACLQGDQLLSCLFLGPADEFPDRSWLSQLFKKAHVTDQDRAAVLAGIPADPEASAGKTICACFGVGEKTIKLAIKKQKLDCIEAIGRQLDAGTNCGSCIPELQRLLQH